jgi:hypothetical protein
VHVPRQADCLRQPLPSSLHLPAISKWTGEPLWSLTRTVTESTWLPLDRHLRNPSAGALSACRVAAALSTCCCSKLPRTAFCCKNCCSSVVPVRPSAGRSSRTHDQRRAANRLSASRIRSPPVVASGTVGCPLAPGGAYVLATLA